MNDDTNFMNDTSFIAILDVAVSPTDRPAAIAHLERQRSSVRSMKGCVAFRVFASHETETDVTVLHEWQDQGAFDAYLESDAFARAGDALRPLMTGPPKSQRFRVTLVETVA